MNKERLEEVAKWLEAGAPERKFNMNLLLDEEKGSTNNNWCGTECCIAGYVVTRYIPQDVNFNMIEEDARKLLGLKESVSNALFYPKVLGSDDYSVSWVSNCGYWEDITPIQAAQAVRNVMEHNDPLWEEILG
jgi:hypothetical protein